MQLEKGIFMRSAHRIYLVKLAQADVKALDCFIRASKLISQKF